MSRLAAPRRRNRFVILQAVRSLPAALHPALLRRSHLQLHVLRLHIGRTFTLLTRQHHRRTHPGKAGGLPILFILRNLLLEKPDGVAIYGTKTLGWYSQSFGVRPTP